MKIPIMIEISAIIILTRISLFFTSMTIPQITLLELIQALDNQGAQNFAPYNLSMTRTLSPEIS
jgi:hypothetical protein